jgi:hypothetical protein
MIVMTPPPKQKNPPSHQQEEEQAVPPQHHETTNPLHHHQQQQQQAGAMLTSIPADVYQQVGGFLNAYDLCQLDETCHTAKQQTLPLWQRLAVNVPTVSAAYGDLHAYNATEKDRATLHYRAVVFAERMEELNAHHMLLSSPCCGGCEDFPDIDQMVLLEPEAFLCFCRISVASSSPSSHQQRTVVWQGFVNPMEQGAWGESTILFFPLQEISEKANWSPAWRHLLSQTTHPQDAVDRTSDYQTAFTLASGQIAVTIIAFRKEYPHLEPSLVCSTQGIDFVTQDNKIYYHLSSRPGQQHAEEQESFLYPRIVASVPTSEQEPSQLLGIRLLAKSAWE